MITEQPNESHIATIDFLWTKLCEHNTWTNEKRAVFSAIRKYLIHCGARIVSQNSMNNLNSLGSYVFISNSTGWANEEIEKGTAELRMLIGHRDSNSETKGKQFAVLKLTSYSSDKHQERLNLLYRSKVTTVHNLWLKHEVSPKLWNWLSEYSQKHGVLTFVRKNEGIGISWKSRVSKSNEELDFELFMKLENTAIELQALGGLYPCIKLHICFPELAMVSIVRTY